MYTALHHCGVCITVHNVLLSTCCTVCYVFSEDKCKPMTEICRTPPNVRYLGKEMFNSVYNHPPPPPPSSQIATIILVNVKHCG